MVGERVLVAAVLVSVVVGGLSVSVAAEQDIAVTAVTLVPSEPQPGERVRLSATVSNLETSDETVRITDVYVRAVGGGELARVEDVGSVAPGSSLTVPLSFVFESAGEKDLRVNVVALDSTGVQRVRYPVQATVGEARDVQLGLDAGEVVAGEDARVNVTVANGGDTPISNLELVLSSDGRVDNPRRVSSNVAAQTDQVFAFDVRFDEAGAGRVEAALTYTTGNSVTRRVGGSLELTVEPASATTDGRIQLTGIETRRVGETVTIQGEAANVGITDARSVLLGVEGADGVTPVQPSKEYFIGTVEGSEFGTFELTADVDRSVSMVPVRVEWTVDDERRSTVVAVDVGPAVTGSEPADGEPRGGLLGALGAVLLVLGVVLAVGMAVFVWRRR